MAFLRQHKLAVLIVGLYLTLGALYSVTSPLFESSDEQSHYPFIQHLATGGGLPVQRASEQSFWRQEGSQPPFYYALSALLTAWASTDDMAALLYRNPHARLGEPAATENLNMYIHTSQEAFPWHGTALAVHLIRFFSVWLGAGTILCTYTMSRDFFPRQPVIAIAAMAINAFIPMFVFISASVNNDNLVILLSSLALLLLVRVIRRGASVWLLLEVGAVIGLACLTKLSALGLLPLACLALALRYIRTPRHNRERPWFLIFARWIGECALIIVPASLVAGWWYVRNWLFYGDPLGLDMMVTIAGGRPPLRTLSELVGEFRGFRYSFWGVLGGFNVLLRPTWVYVLLDFLFVLSLVGLAAWTRRAWRKREPVPWL